MISEIYRERPLTCAKDTVEGTLNLGVLYFQRNNLFSGTPGVPCTLTWHHGEEVHSSISYILVGLPREAHSIRLNYNSLHGSETHPCNYVIALTRTFPQLR